MAIIYGLGLCTAIVILCSSIVRLVLYFINNSKGDKKDGK